MLVAGRSMITAQLVLKQVMGCMHAEQIFGYRLGRNKKPTLGGLIGYSFNKRLHGFSMLFDEQKIDQQGRVLARQRCLALVRL